MQRSICRDLGGLLGCLVLFGPLMFASGPSSMLQVGGPTLALQVSDLNHRPVAGIEIAIIGGSSALTTDSGEAQLYLRPGISAGSRVNIQIVRSPANRDYVISSPSDHSIIVPSCNESSNCVVHIVVAQKGDGAMPSKTVPAANPAGIYQTNPPPPTQTLAVPNAQKPAQVYPTPDFRGGPSPPLPIQSPPQSLPSRAQGWIKGHLVPSFSILISLILLAIPAAVWIVHAIKPKVEHPPANIEGNCGIGFTGHFAQVRPIGTSGAW